MEELGVYVVRIYRRDTAGMAALVESVSSGEQAPFHTTEELWRALGHGPTLAYEPWPAFDPALTKADEIEVPVQVNGKLKARLKVPAEIADADLEAAAMGDAAVQAAITGKTVKLVKVVPRKLVNVVVA